VKVVNSSLESVAEIRIWNQLNSRAGAREDGVKEIKREAMGEKGADILLYPYNP
jgi:hypothetical protein